MLRIFIYRYKAWGKNVIICGADISSSVYISNKNKNILVLGEVPTQVLDDTTLRVEAKYCINFTQSWKRFVLSLHNNGSSNFLFVNVTKIYQFKAKNLKEKIIHCVKSYINI